MGPKKWSTLSEETLHKGFAAWTFLQSYCSERMVEKGISLSHGQLSKLGVEQYFLQKVDCDGNQVYLGFCLGNATFAALFWPVLLFEDGSGFRGYYLDPDGEAEWVFLTNPVEWRVLRPKAVAFNHQIFMVPDPSQTEPLLKFYLRDTSLHKNLLVADLKFLGSFLKAPDFQDANKKMLRKDMIHALVDFVGEGDPEYINKVKAEMERPEAPKKVGGALDEFVLSELPGEDQSDFKEIAKEVDCQKKIGWSIAEQKWKEAAQPKPKSKARARRKAQAKVKAKAKPKAKRVPRKVWQRLAGQVHAEGPPGPAPAPPEVPQAIGENEMAVPVDPAPSPEEAKEAEAVNEAAAAHAEAMHAEDPQAAVIGAPPPDNLPDDMPLADLLPAGVAANPPAAAAPRVHGRGYINQWQDVACPRCGRTAGHIKLDPGPGNRDCPTWMMRVRDAAGKWGSKYPDLRKRTTSVVGESDEFALRWVQDNKKCCQA